MKQHNAQILNRDEQTRNRWTEKKYDHGFPGSCWFVFITARKLSSSLCLPINQFLVPSLSLSHSLCIFCLFYSPSFFSQSLIWSHLIFVLVVKEPWNDLAAWVFVSVFYLPLTACHQRLSSLASAISLVRHHSLSLHRVYRHFNTERLTLVLTALLNARHCSDGLLFSNICIRCTVSWPDPIRFAFSGSVLQFLCLCETILHVLHR